MTTKWLDIVLPVVKEMHICVSNLRTHILLVPLDDSRDGVLLLAVWA
jgi:hypothetical protein